MGVFLRKNKGKAEWGKQSKFIGKGDQLTHDRFSHWDAKSLDQVSMTKRNVDNNLDLPYVI